MLTAAQLHLREGGPRNVFVAANSVSSKGQTLHVSTFEPQFTFLQTEVHTLLCTIVLRTLPVLCVSCVVADKAKYGAVQEHTTCGFGKNVCKMNILALCLKPPASTFQLPAEQSGLRKWEKHLACCVVTGRASACTQKRCSLPSGCMVTVLVGVALDLTFEKKKKKVRFKELTHENVNFQ